MRPPKPDITDLDLLGSVQLTRTQTSTATKKGKKKKNPKLQCFHYLYGSQVYGTSFGIFGRFGTQKVKGEDALVIKGLTLRILNYQGTVNIGFSKSDPHFFPTTKTIRVGVRAGTGILKKELTIAKKDRPKIIKGNSYRLTLDRLLYTVDGNKPSTDTSRPMPKPPSQTDLIFDSEFYLRDGTNQRPRGEREGNATVEDKNGHTANKNPGQRCLSATLNLIY